MKKIEITNKKGIKTNIILNDVQFDRLVIAIENDQKFFISSDYIINIIDISIMKILSQ